MASVVADALRSFGRFTVDPRAGECVPGASAFAWPASLRVVVRCPSGDTVTLTPAQGLPRRGNFRCCPETGRGSSGRSWRGSREPGLFRCPVAAPYAPVVPRLARKTKRRSGTWAENPVFRPLLAGPRGGKALAPGVRPCANPPARSSSGSRPPGCGPGNARAVCRNNARTGSTQRRCCASPRPAAAGCRGGRRRRSSGMTRNTR